LVRIEQIIGTPDKPGLIPVGRSTWYQLVARGAAPAPVYLPLTTSSSS
jgi:hypothetical protein